VLQAAVQQLGSPVLQAPAQQARQLLPNLPELLAPAAPLQIEPAESTTQARLTSLSTPETEDDRQLLPRLAAPPAEEQRITSLSTPEPREIELPPSPLTQSLVPASTKITLSDAPVEPPAEPVSQEIALPDVAPPSPPPAVPFSREVTLDDAPPQTVRQTSFDLSDIDRNHWAESHENVPSLVRRFEELLVDNTSPNQWNMEHSQDRSYPSSTSSLASYPSGFTEIDAAMSVEKRPQRDPPSADAGPSSYGGRQGRAQPGPSTSTRGQYWADAEGSNPSQVFRPSTHFTMRDGSQYPYTPYVPAQARPTPTQTLQTENEQLRKAIEAQRQLRIAAEARLQQRTRATPAQFQPEDMLEGLRQSRHAPAATQEDDRHVQRTPQVQLPQQPMPQVFEQPQYAPATEGVRPDQPAVQQEYQTNLIEALTRFQMTFAEDRRRTVDQILRHLTTHGQKCTTLKAVDVGYFEPKGMPDSEAAMTFIENFKDAVIHYGDANTLAVLQKCCKNDIARAWVSSLNDDDRTAVAQFIWHWERVLRRDFMPRAAQLYATARNETFKWTQGRSPSEYITHKIRLLKIAGITDDNQVVEELHNGFYKCPEIHIPMEAYVLETGNDVSEYRRAVQRYQESAKLQYDYIRKASPYTASSRREKPPSQSATPGTDKEQGTSTTRSYPTKDTTYQRKDKRAIVRKRKCKNFPACGDGEHFDWECTTRGSQVQSKRAYYISPEEEDDDSEVDLREPDPELETEYDRHQDAHFAAVWRASQGFMAAKCDIKPKKNPKWVPPKPAECRKCRMAFPSRNKLHNHVVATGHNVQTSREVSESALHTRDGGELSTLASFHYAKADFILAPSDRNSSTACIDSGYGNSVVDKHFLESTVKEPTYRYLDTPVVVRGIGGAKIACKEVAIFATYWPTMDGRLAKITRVYHIFPELGCDLLIGMNTIYLERIDMFFSSAIPQMRFGNCEGAAIRISVFTKDVVKKVPVRAATRTVVPPNSSTIVAIKMGRTLPPNQDYIFTPAKLKTISAVGAGALHGIFAHDQQTILFTNVNDTDITIFHNTILGHVESIQKAHHADWDEATEEVNAFFGCNLAIEAPQPHTETVEAQRHSEAGHTSKTFDPEADAEMPLPQEAQAFSTETRPLPNVSTDPCPDMGIKCAEEVWLRPVWLDESYQPQYAFELPKGITVPTIDTTTYKLVVVNEEDDISPEQVEASGKNNPVPTEACVVRVHPV
jgi:hypothetical protein